MPVNHDKVSSVDDPPEDVLAGKIVPSDWNTPHNVLIDLAGPEVTGVLPVDKLPSGIFHSGTADAEGFVTKEECVYAGLPTATYSDGQVVSINGRSHSFVVNANGGAEMHANGLRFTRTASSNAQMSYASMVGMISTILGAHRTKRGGWQLWFRIHSYDFSVASITTTFGQVTSDLTVMGVDLRRARNINGGQNTNAGSPALVYGNNGGEVTHSSAGADAGDVFMVDYLDPWRPVFWVGTWSGGWPAFSTMRYHGNVDVGIGNGFQTMYKWSTNPWYLLLGLYATGASDVTFDRWRLTISVEV